MGDDKPNSFIRLGQTPKMINQQGFSTQKRKVPRILHQLKTVFFLHFFGVSTIRSVMQDFAFPSTCCNHKVMMVTAFHIGITEDSKTRYVYIYIYYSLVN